VRGRSWVHTGYELGVRTGYELGTYRVRLGLLDRLVVELLIEHLDFTEVVSDAGGVESERDNRL